jgi:hypothetical protein
LKSERLRYTTSWNRIVIENLRFVQPAKKFLNGTYQLLIFAEDTNLLGRDIDTTKKNTETLIDAINEVGLEVNAEKFKYMSLFRD